MPYPPGVTDVPDCGSDYHADAAGILETYIRHASVPDDLRITGVAAECGQVGDGWDEIELTYTAKLRLRRCVDPGDVSTELAVKLDTFWHNVSEDLLKGWRK